MLLFLLFAGVMAGTLVLYTFDGGENWVPEESNTMFSLNDVAVSITGKEAVAVGDNGTILLRNEHGSWTNVSPDGLSADLYSVVFGISIVMVCGAEGTLLSSFDGGYSWRLWSEFGHEETDLLSVNFDPTHANSFLITGENGFIYSSVDGIIDTEDYTDFIGSCGRLCSGFPEIVLSQNGEGYNLHSGEVFRISTDSVFIRTVTKLVSAGGEYFAAGDNGTLFSFRQGSLWEDVSSSTQEDLNGISYLSWGSSLCAVGNNGTIIRSTDNGTTWGFVDTGSGVDYTAVSGNGAGVGCIVGKSTLSGLLNSLPFAGDSH